jgi:hypothetical protein
VLRFTDPIVAGTILAIPAIQSPDFVHSVTGWSINQDGTAEFNNMTVRGDFEGSFFFVDSQGAFFYDPASGFLVESIANGVGVNRLGDAFVRGHATYVGGVVATSLDSGAILSYTAPGPAGPWSATQASVVVQGSTTTLNGLINSLQGQVIATAGTAFNATQITTDVWNAPAPPANTSGLLRYRLMPDNTVLVECQLTIAAAAAAGTLVLMTGLTAPWKPVTQQRGPCGFVANGAPSVAQLAAMCGMRWQANAAGSFNVLGFVGGAAASGVVELSFNARYSND